MKAYSTILKDYLPYFATFLILVSIIKAMVFYYVFGIRIIDYVDFSEALLLFFDDILNIVFPIIALTIIIILLSSFIKNQIAIIFYLLLANIVINCIQIFLIMTNYYNMPKMLAIFYCSGLFALIFNVGISLFNYYRRGVRIYKRRGVIALNKFKGDLHPKLFVWCICIIIIGAVSEKLHRDLKYSIAYPADKIVTCEFNNGIIISTGKDVIYLGRTRSSIFFYYPNHKKSQIYNSSEIKRIDIKTNYFNYHYLFDIF